MRLFVAVNFPADFRQHLRDATERLRTADLPVRWVDGSALHLTLKFLGQVARERTAAIAEVLDRAARASRAFTLPVAGFGAFPSVERPRVIWVGCEGVPALELLQNDLETGLERLGFPIEGRAFRPHLTLGRAKKDARATGFRRLPALLGEIEFQDESLVESIELMQSSPGPNGSRYQPVHSVVLGERS